MMTKSKVARGNPASSALASFGGPDSLESLQPSVKPAEDRKGAFFGETPRYKHGDPAWNAKAKHATGYAGKLQGMDPYRMKLGEWKGLEIGGYQAVSLENSPFDKETVRRAQAGFGGAQPRQSRQQRLTYTSPVTSDGPFKHLRHGAPRKTPYPTEVHDEGTSLFSTPVQAPMFSVGTARRQDLGQMSRDRAPADRGVWDSLVSYNVDGNVLPMNGRSVQGVHLNRGSKMGKQGMIEQSKVNPRRMFNDGVMGLGPTDAKFTGVFVDPLTGYEYDAYEQEAAPPNGDWRVKDSGKQRIFEMMHGGWAPGRVRPKKREFAPQDIIPDVDRTDYASMARQRDTELMKIE